MLEQLSDESKEFVLLEFTKELIKNLGSVEVFELKEVLKEEDREKKREKGKIKKSLEKREQLKPLLKPQSSILKPKPVLRIPKTKLPKHLQYLKPTPTDNIQIELGKLSSLIKDPTVRDIECNGPNETLIVKGTFGEKKANIVLTREEIDEVVKKFSEAAKIPAHEGLFKVVVGRMIFSAVISEITGSRFIIKKMIYNPAFR